MFGSILEAITAIFKAIPFFDKWFKKDPLVEENKKRREVDKEHEENKKRGRPSGDFWKDRSP